MEKVKVRAPGQTARLHKSRNVSLNAIIDGNTNSSSSRKRPPKYSKSVASSFLNLFQCNIPDFHEPKTYQVSEKVEYSMRDAIVNRKYDVVQSYLRGELYAYDPNEEIPFLEVYMTGLEYSVYKGDWRMAILFFLNSADPSYNCFDGTILTKSGNNDGEENSDVSEGRDVASPRRRQLSERRIISSRTHHAFSRSEISESHGQDEEGSKRYNEIAGFDGLYCLVNQKEEEAVKVRSSLWLMSRCHDPDHCPPKSMTEGLKLTQKHLLSIGAMDVWRDYFEKIVLTSLLSLRCCLGQSIETVGNGTNEANLPNDVVLHILEYVVDDILSETIHQGFKAVTKHSLNEAQGL